ncbi:hypothetical protein QTP70_033396 [Hemibagrus guttatus]|uniref:Uncharacterized protein n=1 Tax=Hemibagrus guttatus TaxID=175788 RepID=A0AAE0UPN2_9TELE|nr:hypothetical protein QTP70_033396 [Hemibagrus guttatus]
MRKVFWADDVGRMRSVCTGWDSNMSSILKLVHLLPPSSEVKSKDRERSQLDKHTGTSIQGHLDSIGESLQPYLLAVGPRRSRIHSWFIVIDQHALPSPGSWRNVVSFHSVLRQLYVARMTIKAS